MGMDKKRAEQIQKMMEANQQSLKEQMARHVGQRIAENMSQQSRPQQMDEMYNRPFQSISKMTCTSCAKR